MSDTPQGPGWWQASDRFWYPPPDPTALPPPPGVPLTAAHTVANNPGTTAFKTAFGLSSGCLVAAILVPLVLLGGCGVLVALGAFAGGADSSTWEDTTDATDARMRPTSRSNYYVVEADVTNSGSSRADYRIKVLVDSGGIVSTVRLELAGVPPGETATAVSAPRFVGPDAPEVSAVTAERRS